ncbi:MAG: methyltransferase domain-containing protein [Candidatus Omnitrophica bacterium]|nr:methyltransferase domain-containing protein [Candidatus Omnitrophota bacterium]
MSLIVLFIFIPQTLFAQITLPTPGTMVTTSASFVPPMLKGMKVDLKQPFQFDFILDTGNSNLQDDDLKDESNKLIRYFLSSLTIPEKDLWVNLSPYEKNRIIPDEFGTTEMGRDLLAQDYILKQITASLMYPENATGKAFWQKVYKKAYDLYGTTDIPTDTFNKVWIVPDKAVVYENPTPKSGEATVFVVEAKLKVMLEEDYFATSNTVGAGFPRHEDKGRGNRAPTAIIKEVIIPILEKEVNEGANFAQLRQVYYSLILAKWYKDSLKESILNRKYSDQKKVDGVDLAGKKDKQEIYEQYLKAFKKGAFNYIKEEYDPTTQALIPRKYFSGGANFKMEKPIEKTKFFPRVMGNVVGKLKEIAGGFKKWILSPRLKDAAMVVATVATLVVHNGEKNEEFDPGEAVRPVAAVVDQAMAVAEGVKAAKPNETALREGFKFPYLGKAPRGFIMGGTTSNTPSENTKVNNAMMNVKTAGSQVLNVLGNFINPDYVRQFIFVVTGSLSLLSPLPYDPGPEKDSKNWNMKPAITSDHAMMSVKSAIGVLAMMYMLAGLAMPSFANTPGNLINPSSLTAQAPQTRQAAPVSISIDQLKNKNGMISVRVIPHSEVYQEYEKTLFALQSWARDNNYQEVRDLGNYILFVNKEAGISITFETREGNSDNQNANQQLIRQEVREFQTKNNQATIVLSADGTTSEISTADNLYFASGMTESPVIVIPNNVDSKVLDKIRAAHPKATILQADGGVLMDFLKLLPYISQNGALSTKNTSFSVADTSKSANPMNAGTTAILLALLGGGIGGGIRFVGRSKTRSNNSQSFNVNLSGSPSTSNPGIAKKAPRYNEKGEEIIGDFAMMTNNQTTKIPAATSAGRLTHLQKKMIDALAKQRPDKGQEEPIYIADIGFGGMSTVFDLAKELSSQGFKNVIFYGMDYRAEVVKGAQDFVSKQGNIDGISRFQFVNGSFEALQDKGQFDLIVTSNTLMWYDNGTDAVQKYRKNMQQALKENGMAIEATGGGEKFSIGYVQWNKNNVTERGIIDPQGTVSRSNAMIQEESVESIQKSIGEIFPILKDSNNLSAIAAVVKELRGNNVETRPDKLVKWMKTALSLDLNCLESELESKLGIQMNDVNLFKLLYAGHTTEERLNKDNAPLANPGGIDFNPNRLELDKQGAHNDFEMPTNPADMENIQINGLVPVIMKISPVTNLPLLLGANQNSETTSPLQAGS